MLCLKRWLFDFSAPSFVMIWPTFSSALNCSSALKSFMKRDKTWRIGRSSKKWSAMNFRASAWSNRNLVTRRKICNFIPSFWEKENERKAEKSEGICFKQTLLLMTEDCILSYKLWCWAWYCQAKKTKKGLYQRAMQIIKPVECIKERWGACCLVLGWDWIITRSARQRKVNDLGGSPTRSQQPHFCSLLLFQNNYMCCRV